MSVVYGYFNQPNQAQQVMPQLERLGCDSSQTVFIQNADETNRLTEMGLPSHEVACLTEGVRRGGAVVATRVDGTLVDPVVDLMNRSGVQKLDDCVSQWQQSGWDGKDVNGQIVVPVIEEQLQVGKRQVERGGVRVHTHNAEIPVDQDITLHEEKVVVERRPTDRAVTAADSLGDKTYEVHERAEVPVVSKEARVVEEVVVGKEAHERTEHIHDSVTRTEVDVEETKTNR